MMDISNNEANTTSTVTPVRRRKWPMGVGDVRFFLPKQGSSPQKPELGLELPTEKEALVKAFQSSQVFFTVVVWSAVPDTEGDDARIVKQAVKRE